VGAPLLRALTLMRPRGVGGLQTAFVGRDRELDLLLATFARTDALRRPHLVTIMADAGVGKTRLVRELWQRLGAEAPEAVRRTGRCLAYGQGITYWALGEILKEHLGILESDPPEAVRERLGEHEVLGLALGLDVAGDLHPLAARDRLHDACVELLGGLTAERPVVMLVEDLHWAEEPLLDLLERAVRDVDGPLLVIGTARPELLETRPAWGSGLRNASQLWLEPLAADQTAAMVDALLASSLPPALCAEIVDRAEGNPFFVEELLGTLIDRGVLVRRNGGWDARELPSEFELPDTVHAVVAARMDLLPAQEKAALQAAAVTGRVFWESPVIELLAGAAPDFGLLETRDFIRRRSGSTMEGEREYAIKHAVTREVAYASVPKARRARLHAAFAAWLERVGGGRDEHAPLLAHHYAQAVQPDDVDLAWAGEAAELGRLRGKAAFWLRRAGELAVGRYDLDEGLALLRRAVELEPSAGGWQAIGRAHALRYDGEAFWTAMEKALELAAGDELRAEIYSELAFHTGARAGMWVKAPGNALVEEWIEQALALAPPGSAPRARALVARVYTQAEKQPEPAHEAIEIAVRLGDVELRSYAWDALGIAALSHRDVGEASAWERRRLDLVDEISDPDHLHDVYHSCVPTEAALGRFAEARRLALTSYEITQKLSPHHQVHGVAVRAEVEELAGDWEGVRGFEDELRETVAANFGTPCVRNQRSLLSCALARAALGDSAGAEQLEQEAEVYAMGGFEFNLAAPRLRLALARGDLARVEDILGRVTASRGSWFAVWTVAAELDALAALRRRDEVEGLAAPWLAGETLLEPFAARALGMVREDPALIERALARFETLGLDWHAGETRTLLGG
jgi:hypothetical protein